MNGPPSAGSPNSANTALNTAWHSCLPVIELPSVASHPRAWFVSNLKTLPRNQQAQIPWLLLSPVITVPIETRTMLRPVLTEHASQQRSKGDDALLGSAARKIVVFRHGNHSIRLRISLFFRFTANFGPSNFGSQLPPAATALSTTSIGNSSSTALLRPCSLSDSSLDLFGRSSSRQTTHPLRSAYTDFVQLRHKLQFGTSTSFKKPAHLFAPATSIKGPTKAKALPA